MRFGAAPTIATCLVLLTLACTLKENNPILAPSAGGGTGGSALSSGGGTSGGDTGSTSAAGGTSATSSASVVPAAGGTTPTSVTSAGGAVGGGGVRAAGGASGSGGTTPPVSTSTVVCTDVQPTGQSTPCDTWKTWGNCSTPWFVDNGYCNKTCGRCSATPPPSGGGGAGGTTSTPPGGSGGSGGVTAPGSTNPPITGQNSYATRYWDCCKPGCAWNNNTPSCGKDGISRVSDKNAGSGCQGGPAYQCYDMAPWYDPATNMSYGFVAFNSGSCGTCYMFQFTGEGRYSGSDPGSVGLKGQQMVVQVINTGDMKEGQFDLLVPGGGVGANTEGCKAQWGGSTELGTTYGGLLTSCNGSASCMKGKCTSVFGNFPMLLAGCNWFTGWFGSADNPKFIYKQVPCPPQITAKSGVSG